MVAINGGVQEVFCIKINVFWACDVVLTARQVLRKLLEFPT